MNAVILLCRINARNYQLVLAMLFAVNEINLNSHILPNTSLGLEIYNLPAIGRNIFRTVFSWLTGLSSVIPNYTCRKESNSAVTLTGVSWKTSETIWTILDLYKFPQVSASDVSDEQPELFSLNLAVCKMKGTEFDYLS